MADLALGLDQNVAGCKGVGEAVLKCRNDCRVLDLEPLAQISK